MSHYELEPESYLPFAPDDGTPIDLGNEYEGDMGGDATTDQLADTGIIPDQTVVPDEGLAGQTDAPGEYSALADIPWRATDWREADHVSLEPYTIIEGVPTYDAFLKVEAGICAAIKRIGWPGEPTDMYSEPSVTRKPLNYLLLPKKYSGGIYREGDEHFAQALLLPFHDGRGSELEVQTYTHPRMIKEQEEMVARLAPYRQWVDGSRIGARVVYSYIYTTPDGTKEHMQVAVTYHGLLRGRGNVQDLGRMRRTAEKPVRLAGIEDKLAQRHATATTAGRIMAANALRSSRPHA
jgi:hypothetical protein